MDQETLSWERRELAHVYDNNMVVALENGKWQVAGENKVEGLGLGRVAV